MTNIDMLMASIMYLFTRQNNAPQAKIARAIVDHLQILADHPDCDSEVIKETARRLSCAWKQELRALELRDSARENDIAAQQQQQHTYHH